MGLLERLINVGLVSLSFGLSLSPSLFLSLFLVVARALSLSLSLARSRSLALLSKLGSLNRYLSLSHMNLFSVVLSYRKKHRQTQSLSSILHTHTYTHSSCLSPLHRQCVD